MALHPIPLRPSPRNSNTSGVRCHTPDSAVSFVFILNEEFTDSLLIGLKVSETDGNAYEFYGLFTIGHLAINKPPRTSARCQALVAKFFLYEVVPHLVGGGNHCRPHNDERTG